MLRFVIRFLGFWLFAGAIILAVLDGARSVAASRVVVTSLSETWASLAPESLTNVEATLERTAVPSVNDFIAAWLLGAPAWAVVGAVALILVAIGRRRRVPPYHYEFTA